MSFSSIHFIFGFLPIFIFFFFVSKKPSARRLVLTIGSMFFIGWVDPTNIPILISALIINFFLGRFIDNLVTENRITRASIITVIAVLVNIFFLLLTKYTNFFLISLNQVIGGEPLEIHQNIPLGVSYFTFTSISYLIDIYLGKISAERSIISYSVYILMFPKFIQGPITRYKETKPWVNLLEPSSQDISDGIRRFIGGLGKKTLLADKLSNASKPIFSSDFTQLGSDLAWFSLIAFSVQIYLDFSGYTDMAIGLGKILGIKLPENFNYPYTSRSITDFWRRWHISLTSWFKSYVFLPLELSTKKKNLSIQSFHILVVFGLTGFWHGPNWNFLIWGVYFGILLILELVGFQKILNRLPVIIQYFYTWLLISLSWMLFRIDDITTWPVFLSSLFGFHGWSNQLSLRNLNILFYVPVLLISLIFCTPLLGKFSTKLASKHNGFQIGLDMLFAFIFFLTIATIITNGFSPFEYERF